MGNTRQNHQRPNKADLHHRARFQSCQHEGPQRQAPLVRRTTRHILKAIFGPIGRRSLGKIRTGLLSFSRASISDGFPPQSCTFASNLHNFSWPPGCSFHSPPRRRSKASVLLSIHAISPSDIYNFLLDCEDPSGGGRTFGALGVSRDEAPRQPLHLEFFRFGVNRAARGCPEKWAHLSGDSPGVPGYAETQSEASMT